MSKSLSSVGTIFVSCTVINSGSMLGIGFNSDPKISLGGIYLGFFVLRGIVISLVANRAAWFFSFITSSYLFISLLGSPSKFRCVPANPTAVCPNVFNGV